jgi:hypothetical protein
MSKPYSSLKGQPEALERAEIKRHLLLTHGIQMDEATCYNLETLRKLARLLPPPEAAAIIIDGLVCCPVCKDEVRYGENVWRYWKRADVDPDEMAILLSSDVTVWECSSDTGWYCEKCGLMGLHDPAGFVVDWA